MYPSFSQFCRWADKHSVVPLWIEPELPAKDLLDWAHNLNGAEQKFFFLHSASDPGTQARYSYVALDAPRYSLEARGGELMIRYYSDAGARGESLKIGNPVERFQEWFGAFDGPRVDALPPFWGGAVGYFGYDSARHFDPDMRRIAGAARGKPASLATEKFPDFEFGVYDAVAVVDHARARLWLVHTIFLPKGKRLSPLQLERAYRLGQDRLRRHAVRLQKALRHRRSWGAFRASEVRSNRSSAAYQVMVRRAKRWIASGDLYQCNLSQSLSAQWEGDPWMLYRRLCQINPSPYNALWRSGTRWMVSASPELLVRQQAGYIETRPIAGTYPRSSSPEQDPMLLEKLRKDAKERAEHIMLVDLERNDLGRVCLPKTIRVAESLTVEAYSHVLHLVSDIRGQLAPHRTWLDSLRACFPGGTITGCPKLRCMEIIQKLEPQRRGPYTGSLGWIGFNGDMTFNILIRSFFLEKGRLSFPVGAGIVADSHAPTEYQETLHKARALLEALQGQGAGKLSHRKLE